MLLPPSTLKIAASSWEGAAVHTLHGDTDVRFATGKSVKLPLGSSDSIVNFT